MRDSIVKVALLGALVGIAASLQCSSIRDLDEPTHLVATEIQYLTAGQFDDAILAIQHFFGMRQRGHANRYGQPQVGVNTYQLQIRY